VTRLATTPFDQQARDYDARFSNRLAARWLRDMTRRRIEPLAGAGDVVVEIGCGTGLDAAWLAGRGCHVVATDASDSMLGVACARPLPAEVAARIRWSHLDAARPGNLAELVGTGRRVKLVLSNFGALNCVRDLAPLFDALRPVLDVDGRVAFVLMGRFCLWESVYFAAHRRWAAMRRRWNGSSRYGDATAAIDVWYHSPADVLRAAPGFTKDALYGIGALLPPTEAFAFCERWPRLFGHLAAADDRLARWLHGLSDHYLLVLRPAGATA
jgi:SAM-dependent methyltransferase